MRTRRRRMAPPGPLGRGNHIVRSCRPSSPSARLPLPVRCSGEVPRASSRHQPPSVWRSNLDPHAVKRRRERRGHRLVADRVAGADVACDLLERPVHVVDGARRKRRAAACVGEPLEALRARFLVQRIDECDGVDDDVRGLRPASARRRRSTGWRCRRRRSATRGRADRACLF